MQQHHNITRKTLQTIGLSLLYAGMFFSTFPMTVILVMSRHALDGTPMPVMSELDAYALGYSCIFAIALMCVSLLVLAFTCSREG